MPENRTGVYIDGLNFYYGALKGGPHKWLNLDEFAGRLFPRDQITRIRYFTAVVNSRPNDPGIPVRHATYLRALRTLPTTSIHLGRFASRVRTRVLADEFEHHSKLFAPHFRPRSLFSLMWSDKVRRRNGTGTLAKVVIEEEKGSDVNLGVHLVHDAARGHINKALVISNDSDLAEALELTKGFGVSVGLLNPHTSSTSKHLREASSFVMPFRREFLGLAQFPDTVMDYRGREIHKPKEWR